MNNVLKDRWLQGATSSQARMNVKRHQVFVSPNWGKTLAENYGGSWHRLTAVPVAITERWFHSLE
jgi:hypothetical protein